MDQASYEIGVVNGAPQRFNIQATAPLSDSALNDIADIIAGDIPAFDPPNTVDFIHKAEIESVTVT